MYWNGSQKRYVLFMEITVNYTNWKTESFLVEWLEFSIYANKNISNVEAIIFGKKLYKSYELSHIEWDIKFIFTILEEYETEYEIL